jgi:hypothetical protein
MSAAGKLLEAVQDLSVPVGAPIVIEEVVPIGVLYGVKGQAQLAEEAVGEVDG